jgi:hypothetical protein
MGVLVCMFLLIGCTQSASKSAMTTTLDRQKAVQTYNNEVALLRQLRVRADHEAEMLHVTEYEFQQATASAREAGAPTNKKDVDPITRSMARMRQNIATTTQAIVQQQAKVDRARAELAKTRVRQAGESATNSSRRSRQ